MPIKHKAALRDDSRRCSVVGTREGQSSQGMILLKETTIPNEVT